MKMQTARDQARSLLDEIRDICAAHGVKTRAMDKLEVLISAFMEVAPGDFWARYGLSKKERRLAELLHKRLGQCVSRDALLDAMYFDSPGGGDHIEDPRKIIDVFICKMRPKILHSPYEVESSWGDGFRMVLRKVVSPQSWACYGLTGRERDVASALQARGGENVTIEELLDAIYPEGRKPRKNLHIFIFRARQKLGRSPFQIKYDRGLGYRIVYRSEPTSIALQKPHGVGYRMMREPVPASTMAALAAL